MKTRFQPLATAVLLLSCVSVAIADDESGFAVSDLPDFGEDAYFHVDAAYGDEADDDQLRVSDPGLTENEFAEQGNSDNYVSDSSQVQYVSDSGSDGSAVAAHQPVPQAAPQYDSAAVPPMQWGPSSGHVSGGYIGSGCDTGACSGSCSGSCSGNCDAGCGRGYADSCGRICDIFDREHCSGWGKTEALLWFAQARKMPALVSTSNAGTLPVLPAGGANPNNVQVVFGGEIEGDLSAGFRGDYGKWITNRLGIGGRFWILNENSDSISLSGDGTDQSIGRPFFNSNPLVPPAVEDALLIAINGNPAPGGSDFTGSVRAKSSLDIWAAEAYSRMVMACGRNHRLEFLGGYSHFDIEDSLRMTSTSTRVANPADARVRIYNDAFLSENIFNGGQLGFEMSVTRGCWTFSSLTKVHLGNMRQTVSIDGDSSDQIPPAVANVTDGGLLALGNQGTFERDVFAFAPEANFKLGYRFRPNVLMSIGYSFIYWDNVTLNGDVIDRVIDGQQLNTGVFSARPAFNFDDSSLWVQGIDLGVVVDF